MRGTVSRQLRKSCGFVPSDKRTYQKLEHVVVRNIMQFDSVNKTTKLVPKEVSAYTVECTHPERNLYKYYKAKYNDLNKSELVLNQLPNEEKLNDISKQIKEDILRTKEGVPTVTGGGLLSEISSSGGSENEEGRLDVESEIPSSEG